MGVSASERISERKPVRQLQLHLQLQRLGLGAIYLNWHPLTFARGMLSQSELHVDRVPQLTTAT